MNKKELKNKIELLPFDQDYFSLDGKAIIEGHVLYQKNPNNWIYYFFERGAKYSERQFSSEEEACMYVYQILIKEAKHKV